jgi:hypothetical protein
MSCVGETDSPTMKGYQHPSYVSERFDEELVWFSRKQPKMPEQKIFHKAAARNIFAHDLSDLSYLDIAVSYDMMWMKR